LAKLYRKLERSEKNWAAKMEEKITESSNYFLHPILRIPLLFLPFVLRDKRLRFLLAALALLLLGLALEEWVWPHYAAPGACLIAAVLMQCLRHFRTIVWDSHRVGQVAVALLVILSFGVPAVRLMRLRSGTGAPPSWAVDRVRISESLPASGGRHLIVVRYSPDHNPHDEWVYNAADIEGSPVVWAREMSDMRQLFEHFPSRKVWLLEADRLPRAVKPYPSTGSGAELAGEPSPTSF
jgi:hypothetical protein